MNKFIKYFYSTFVYLFLYIPIAVVITLSFNNASRSMVWKGFTLDWYRELLHDGNLITVALHSLSIGVLAASLATALGTLAAVSIFRYRFFGKQFMYGLIFVMILIPEIVMGISLLILYTLIKIPLGFWSLLIAHTTLCIPFAAVTVYSRIVTFDREVFEAAKDLGASDFTIFRKIVIPLLSPAIVAGWLLSFTLSLDDVITSYFVAGPAFEVLPLRIYSMVRLGIKPEINALCTLLLLATLILVLVAQSFLRKSKGIRS